MWRTCYRSGIRAVVITLVGWAALSAPARAVEPNELLAVSRDAGRLQIIAGRSKVVTAPWKFKRVSVTDPAVADVQPLSAQTVLVIAKTAGTTDLMMWNEQEELWRTDVQVLVDLGALHEEIRDLFPDDEIAVRQSKDMVVLTGRVSRAEHIEQLGKLLTAKKIKYVDMTSLAGAKQVQIQVRIAEVSRQAVRVLGFNAFHTGSAFFGAQQIGSDGGVGINPVYIGAPAGAVVESGLPFQTLEATSPLGTVSVFAGFPDWDFEFFLQALEENQYMRLLAKPTLTALSGETASFLAGGEFPIPVAQSGSGGEATITIDYREYGVRLVVRPVVMGDNTIRLYVAPEVSELSDVGSVSLVGTRVPSLVTRRAETTLDLKSGQTMAIAGLIRRSEAGRSSRVPLLGNVPILGMLFRSTRYQTGETELVTMVTASLVEPTSNGPPPVLPGDLLRPPNDWEFYGLGRVVGGTPAKLSPRQVQWLRKRGLDRLKGPGAWVPYNSPPPPPAAQPAAENSPEPGPTPSVQPGPGASVSGAVAD